MAKKLILSEKQQDFFNNNVGKMLDKDLATQLSDEAKFNIDCIKLTTCMIACKRRKLKISSYKPHNVVFSSKQQVYFDNNVGKISDIDLQQQLSNKIKYGKDCPKFSREMISYRRNKLKIDSFCDSKRPHKDKLYNLYVTQFMTAYQIAKLYEVDPSTIADWLHKDKITIRPQFYTLKQ